MCLFTVKHFSYHKVAVRMTIEPFTTDGTGDYISPCIVQGHECKISVLGPLDPDSSEPENLQRQLHFLDCQWHGTCCITWTQVSHCRITQRMDRDFECPNVARFHEYYPITETMDICLDGDEAPEPCWEDAHSDFPSHLIFFKDKQGDDDFEDTLDLRQAFCETTHILYDDKKELADLANAAWDQLNSVQQVLDAGGVAVQRTIEPEIAKAIELVESAREQMNQVLCMTREVVKSYHGLQLALGNPAAMFADLPGFNPENLGEDPESLRLIFEKFQGPLKGILELFEWCKRMRLVQRQLNDNYPS